jgi:hypothetical protein
MKCVFCGEEIQIEGKVSRQDTCRNCHRDLRCCKQCMYYDPGAYNECREILAERIPEKERANFCDYFVPKGAKNAGGTFNRTMDAKKALEALFKKK